MTSTNQTRTFNIGGYRIDTCPFTITVEATSRDEALDRAYDLMVRGEGDVSWGIGDCEKPVFTYIDNEEIEEEDGPRFKYVCPECGSDQVAMFSVRQYWNVERQEWISNPDAAEVGCLACGAKNISKVLVFADDTPEEIAERIKKQKAVA